MSDATPRIDHVMVKVGDRLDAAVDRYSRFGFQLAPRGHHSVGTSNHLAVFEEDYFELVGYEPRNAARASGAWGKVDGFAGLVLKTPDANALALHLRDRSIAMVGDGPRNLSRPVELPDGTVREARFSSIHIDPDLTPSGLVLICQHHTPELVWRREWQAHPNGVNGIAGMTVASMDPARSIGLLAAIYGAAAMQTIEGGLRLSAGNASIDYVVPEIARARFGGNIVLAPDGADRNVAVAFRVSSLAVTERVLGASGIAAVARKDAGLLVPAPAAFGVALAFGESP